jgi:LPXTG-motif cell wall-anchored protein
MNRRLTLLTAAAIAATGSVLAVGAPASAAEGTFTPTTIEPGETFQVSFSNAGVTYNAGADTYDGDDQCDDYGYDDGNNGTYSNRPMWVGFLAGDQTGGDPDELDLYDGTVAKLTIGILDTYTHQNPDNFGWVGSFSGSGILPDLDPGTYTVALSCGYPDSTDPDGNGTPVLIKITVPAEPVVPAIDLELELILDQTIDGGGLEVPVEGSGLQPGADYTVTLRSDPVVIGTGIVDENGGFAASYPIPANTPDGGHSVTVDSLDTQGNPVSAVGYFNLQGGVVAGVSDTTPFQASELPATGRSVLPMVLAASVLVLAGGFLIRRRAA